MRPQYLPVHQSMRQPHKKPKQGGRVGLKRRNRKRELHHEEEETLKEQTQEHTLETKPSSKQTFPKKNLNITILKSGD